jgi:PAS domain S-box-containing protein
MLLLLAGGVYGAFYLRTRGLTQRKRILEELVRKRTRMLTDQNRQLERLSIVARETENGVVILDPRANIEWINEGFVRMFGFTQDQLIREKGGDFRDFCSHEDLNEMIDSCITDRRPVTYEVENITRGGEKKWVQVTLTPTLDRKGRVERLIAVLSDISALKEASRRAQQERQTAQKASMAKSDFLARMSHEIRTPMNGVIGFTEMLMQTPLNPEQRDYLKTISRSGEALLRLINDILDFSRIEAGKLSFEEMDFDPELMAYDVCEIMAPRSESREVEIICNVADTMPSYIRSDPGRFRQVLTNLMANAVKFTDHGEVELAMEVEKETARNLLLHIRVRDTGMGIPAEKAEQIFDVFTQAEGTVNREYGGSGLGLAICRQIAQKMKGDIQVESELGKGSTFHFTAWVQKSPKRSDAPSVYDNLEGKRVLVVDDNPINLEMLKHILNVQGMQVIAVTSAQKAIDLLKSMKGRDGFDVCVIDILMPECDGYRLARRIRKLTDPAGRIPLLALSSSHAGQLKTYTSAGFNGFLPKPVQKRKLTDMLQRLLGGEEARVDGEIQTQYSVVEDRKHTVHILVAEDNPVNQKLACHLLTKAGYRVTLVDNGVDAIQKVREAPRRYHLVLMDIQMPRMDGHQATRVLRSEGYTEIPIIAITAQSMKGDREKCLKAGMNDYIAKPIKREKVFRVIKQWVLS